MRVDENKGEGLVLDPPPNSGIVCFMVGFSGGLVGFLVYNKLSRILVMPINSSCPILITSKCLVMIFRYLHILSQGIFLKGVLNF